MARSKLEKGCEHWGFNMEYPPKDIQVVTPGGVVHGTETRVGVVGVPLLTNAKPLAKGKRLFFGGGEEECDEGGEGKGSLDGR